MVGAVGAMRRENWGLFFLFPALFAVAVAPLVGGTVIVTMMLVEILAGSAIRSAYSLEAFWSAAMMAGMVLGVAFAVIAVLAGAEKAKA